MPNARGTDGPAGTDKLLTLDEISELTHMPVATLRYKRHRGELPFIFKIGRRLVAHQGDLDEWIDAQRVATRRTAHAEVRGG